MGIDSLLENISRHVILDEEETASFISAFKKADVKKKNFLLREGDVCKYESFVTHGCLKMYSIDKNGYEHIVMFAVEDWWAADLYSLLSESPSLFYIQAMEDTKLLQISRQDLENLYIKIPKLERFFRILFQNAFIAQQQRINQSLSANAEERYLHFVAKYPKLEQRLPQKQVAAYLGITPEFLSMIRKKLVNRH